MARRSVTLAETRTFIREAAARQAPWRRALEAVTRATGVSAAGLILVLLAVAAWIVGYWVGGRPLFLVAYAAAAVLGGAWLYGRRPLPLTGQRTAPVVRVSEGRDVRVEVSLTAGRRLSTVLLEEQVPPLLGDHARLAIAQVEPEQPVTHAYELTCWRRGVYRLGPLVARWGDPFGLTERELRLAEPFEVIVHPRIEHAEDHPLTRLWEDPPYRPPISRPWPHGLEFYGMREYARGDDVRKIVWRAFARTGQLLVRESEQGITDKLVVIVDTDASNHSKGIVSESFEAACRVAASLSHYHFREGFSVTLHGNDAKLAGPLRGPTAEMRFLDALARAEPTKGSLSDAFGRLLVEIPRDVHVVLITPLLDRQAAARLRLLVERGLSVLVVALLWHDEAVDTLASAASLGVRVVEVGPNTNLSSAFRREVAAAGAAR